MLTGGGSLVGDDRVDGDNDSEHEDLGSTRRDVDAVGVHQCPGVAGDVGVMAAVHVTYLVLGVPPVSADRPVGPFDGELVAKREFFANGGVEHPVLIYLEGGSPGPFSFDVCQYGTVHVFEIEVFQ